MANANEDAGLLHDLLDQHSQRLEQALGEDRRSSNKSSAPCSWKQVPASVPPWLTPWDELSPRALPAVARQAPSTREPPSGAFGSLNLGRPAAPPADNTQPLPGFSGASNPWLPLSAQEYEPSPAVQQAAAGVHEPPYQPRYDPRPLAPRDPYQPYDLYEPNPAAHTGRQRLFTTTNPQAAATLRKPSSMYSKRPATPPTSEREKLQSSSTSNSPSRFGTAAAGVHEPPYQPRYDPRPLAPRDPYQPYDLYEPNPAAHTGR
ncbi:hypothetical protein IscW_ISCW004673 [Ixodes scapularis]|uniref:Uncharacterized protein n=1 Tax=Ixodes scapularis TaxID=6945 RepID=B7PI57_IXOSC|nr:hypothetical protein IscW_ISCW004673 [Ixodes scapularis]|eukprot:XP_002404422.1 hypothetical protein IscW_ISCW004673 [Ixodes scapularis]